MQTENYLTDGQYKNIGDEMEQLAAPLIELLEELAPHVQHDKHANNTSRRLIPKLIAELKRIPVEVRGGFGIVAARAAERATDEGEKEIVKHGNKVIN